MDGEWKERTEKENRGDSECDAGAKENIQPPRKRKPKERMACMCSCGCSLVAVVATVIVIASPLDTLV